MILLLLLNLNSLTGNFDIVSNVGSIDLEDIIFVGDTKIRADVGDITCSFNEDMKDASDISIITNIGNINLDTKDLVYTVDDTHEDDDNFLGSSKIIDIKDLCKVNTEISLGKLIME